MSSSTDTQSDTTLQPVLAEIVKIDSKLVELNDQIDTLKARREHLEQLALEEFQTQRLDGVRVAGRSWRVEWTHSCSVPEARKEAVMEAARQAGLLDAVTQVNTARLKSLLKEMANEAGTDARSPWSQGTVFEGLVGEFVQPKLRHLTVG